MASPSLQFVPQWLKKPTTPGLDSPTTPSAFAFGNGPASPRHPLGASGGLAQAQSEDFALHLPGAVNGKANGDQLKSTRSKSRPQRYSKEQMISLVNSEKSRHLPNDLMEWTVQLGINGVVNSVGQHGGSGFENGDGAGQGEEVEAQVEEDRRSYPQKRYGDRDRQDSSSRQGRSAAAGLNSPDITRAAGRALGFGRGEGGGAFGGGDSHSKGSNRFGILDGDTADAPGRERRERNPWRDAETGFRDRDRQDRLEKAEKEGGGMSGGGRYIPANGGFASPVIEKAGLVERRGVRGPVLRRDTAEAAEKDVVTPNRNLNQSSSAWRPTLRNTPASATGSFEGVLGSFGGGVSTPSKQKNGIESGSTDQISTPSAWKERERVTSASDLAAGIMPGSGGGPGWGKTGRWRSAAQQQEDEDALKRPNIAPLAEKSEEPKPSASTAVIPPATPVSERDHQLEEPQQPNGEHFASAIADDLQDSKPRQPEISNAGPDPASIQWFYRDPHGNEQGPFAAPQMQEWFTANYFQSDLPLRRSMETSFRSLQVLKEETQSDDRPFLTRPPPKLPPNLPIPGLVASQTPPSVNDAAQTDTTRLAPQNDTLRQMLAELQQNQSSGETRHLQTPMRNGAMGATSPGLSINRSVVDPFAQSASYASSPVSQHAGPVRSVWDSATSPAIGRPSVPTSPFAPEMIAGVQHMGGFPQPQFAQQRSIFDSQPSQPQSPYAPSPWGMQMPPQMQHHLHQPNFPTSPFGQMPQQPFAQYPAQPIAPVWQNAPFGQSPGMSSPAPMSAQPAQQYMTQQNPLPQNTYNKVPQAFSPSPLPAQINSDFIKSPAPESQSIEEPAEPAPEVKEQTSVVTAASSQPEPAVEVAQSLASPPAPVKPVSTSKPVQAEIKKEVSAAPVVAQAPLQPEVRAPSPPVAAPSVAPWAEDKAKPAKSMSLKEIQEAEAQVVEKRKSAEAKAKAALAATQPVAESSDIVQSMTFGLASRPALNTASSTASNTSAPVWGATPVVGSKKQMPKRTLQQIQEEERAKKLAQVKAAAAAGMAESAQAASTKRGYADLAATSPATTPGGGWATVGAGGKAVAPAPTAAATSLVAKPRISTTPSMITSVVSNKATVVKPKPQTLNEVSPSIEFVRWTKEQLKGLTGANVDEFIQMLLTFPVEPPHKDEMLEIIAESVYANSSTLDGKRFANNFYMRRKEDAIDRVASNGKSSAAKVTSLADIVKTQPKAPGSDFGFKVVKKKGKKN